MEALLDRLIGSIDLSRTYIFPPPPRILLCGGQREETENSRFCSVRDALYRSAVTKGKDFYQHILLPENIFKFYMDSGYPDLLTFERDLAELSTLTIVIPEGPGSIAELGAFSVLSEINKKLLVVIHEDHVDAPSFISNGPIRFLKELRDDSVVVHSWVINDEGEFESFEELPDLVDYLDDMTQEKAPKQLFDRNSASHQLFIILELLKVVLLATEKDLLNMLKKFGQQPVKNELQSRLKLLKHLDLVDVQHYQSRSFYILKRAEYRFVKFGKVADSEAIDPMRVGVDFSEYYRENDKCRARAYKKYITKNGN
ncbi:retron St85 family effector protein [Maridesulfovibrio sp.]|uniref:retron St85 family effector protein n=1 Tax=Maridesulfovibrio sp. TaxID=2795000 RepID=UPI0029C9FD06|nr:retron St85 family effector protein [Maridesulfovibrio sp.]